MNQNKKPAKSWGATSSKFDKYNTRNNKKNTTGKPPRPSMSTNSGIRTGTTSMTNGDRSNSRVTGQSKGSIFSNSSYSEIGLSGILRQTASKIADKAKKLVRFVAGNNEQEIPDNENGEHEMKESKTPATRAQTGPTPDDVQNSGEIYVPENNQTANNPPNPQSQGGIYREPHFGLAEPQNGFAHLDDSINEQFLQVENPRPSYEGKSVHPAPGTGSSSSRRPNSVNLSDRSIASKEKSEARKSRDGQRHSLRSHYTKSNNNNVNTSLHQYGDTNITNVVNNITLNVSGLVGALSGSPKQSLTLELSTLPTPTPTSKFNLTQKSPNGTMKKSGDNAVKRQLSIGIKNPDGSTSMSSSTGFGDIAMKKKEGDGKKITIDIGKFKDGG